MTVVEQCTCTLCLIAPCDPINSVAARSLYSSTVTPGLKAGMTDGLSPVLPSPQSVESFVMCSPTGRLHNSPSYLVSVFLLKVSHQLCYLRLQTILCLLRSETKTTTYLPSVCRLIALVSAMRILQTNIPHTHLCKVKKTMLMKLTLASIPSVCSHILSLSLS